MCSSRKHVVVGTLFLQPIILMYSGWSYWVFRGKYDPTSAVSEPAPRQKELAYQVLISGWSCRTMFNNER